ncbi:hypothetical protein LEP1GSC036_0173 [Leptospira weilii str. 2006001853]|uniref:PF06250 domain protein n=1 Tax=Leptospira weilii str. 2006001853 TaxID=1001589 RepID=A0A828Z697_9LEPT|nr:hypothetical protein LEP1GSC036_0173 [Leptospira weilii str. 2006001853]EMN46779.1 hypothetical protein LEP1GSC086_0981 [Leptospira weilii str. LNT 1234]QDK21853.1 hypothetical protein FHG67_03150 [Leptospira weilii]QDK25791.1 hypothetical protein FHG68_03005 [Leptospira weilii]
MEKLLSIPLMSPSSSLTPKSYKSLLTDVARIYESFQSNANSDWNKISLTSYWKIGQRIVEVEQGNRSEQVTEIGF